MEQLKPKVSKLVQELGEKLQLSDVDARRAAFVVLAHDKGWSKARMARYLGITRHRVGQRITKYGEYAANGEYPVLASNWNSSPKPSKDPALPVRFSRQDWEELNFSNAMLNRLV